MSDYSDADLFDLIEAKRGNLSAIAKEITVPRHVLKARIDRSPILVALMGDLIEAIVDKAEQNKFTDVENGDSAASNFVLQTLGKGRGWAMGVAGSGKDGAILVEIKTFTEPTDASS